jgi:hypothetical protein
MIIKRRLFGAAKLPFKNGRTSVMSKARGYSAKAKQFEARAKKGRDLESREWHTTVARAYRMLAEAESEVTARRLSAAA